MAISLPIENILIQVRAKLQNEQIKLWLPPYYEEGIGPIDSELEVWHFFGGNGYTPVQSVF